MFNIYNFIFNILLLLWLLFSYLHIIIIIHTNKKNNRIQEFITKSP